MLDCFATEGPSLPLDLITSAEFETWLAAESTAIQNQVTSMQFSAKPQQCLYIHDNEGQLQRVIYGVGDGSNVGLLGALAKQLPAAIYHFNASLSDASQFYYALAWAYGAYQYDVYREDSEAAAKLLLPTHERDTLLAITGTSYFVRDLINTPANDMGPAELAEALESIAGEHQAEFTQLIDDELLAENYPLIYAVGEGSARAPRLLQLRAGNPDHFKLTLVGKGVCYDTGGLNLKPGAGMANMKKDMGGAAHVIGLAKLIMQLQLPIYLHVLIPAVENSVSGSSYRPGDVLIARNGLSVEITNTDAEGRLVLADALVEASAHEPDLILDFATLTGAARVALGPDIAPFMTDNAELAAELCAAGTDVNDPLWPLPLPEQYKRFIKSPIADLVNSSKLPYAGAITAGLFLQQFVADDIPWVHFDVFGWHADATPGREVGAAVSGMRAVLQYLQQTVTAGTL